MVLGERERSLVGSSTSVAYLSSDTWAKQLHRHPELVLDDYRRLVDLGAEPQLVLRQGDTRIIMIRVDGRRWLKATIKTTSDRKELFVVSVQFADARELRRLRRTNDVIFDAGV